MVKEGIILGHKISSSGIEVDKAKIEAISKLPYPTNVKAIRSFLGHVGFHRRFIKDFSQIARPMTKLLVKDVTFNFSEECIHAFEKLKFFAFDKFCQYLVLSKTIIFTDHSALWYFFTKQDANPRLIRWILLLQEFNINIRDKKGDENLVTDHLSRLENPDLGKLTKAEIRDLFPEERLMKISNKNNEPWYADYANYLASLCADQIIRRCVAGDEVAQILRQCHSGPSGGNHDIATTARKVFKAEFYWPHIFQDARTPLPFMLKAVLRKTKVEMLQTIFGVQRHENDAIKLYDEDGNGFIVNKQRVKPYQNSMLDTNIDNDITLEDEEESCKNV
ncbi:reverse transcriptase domain-containing protein [Tanacetum coccineum]